MTIDEAYQRGQRDMRNRIEHQWQGWLTNTLGGLCKANAVERKQYGNVAILIRRNNPIRKMENGTQD